MLTLQKRRMQENKLNPRGTIPCCFLWPGTLKCVIVGASQKPLKHLLVHTGTIAYRSYSTVIKNRNNGVDPATKTARAALKKLARQYYQIIKWLKKRVKATRAQQELGGTGRNGVVAWGFRPCSAWWHCRCPRGWICSYHQIDCTGLLYVSSDPSFKHHLANRLKILMTFEHKSSKVKTRCTAAIFKNSHSQCIQWLMTRNSSSVLEPLKHLSPPAPGPLSPEAKHKQCTRRLTAHMLRACAFDLWKISNAIIMEIHATPDQFESHSSTSKTSMK